MRLERRLADEQIRPAASGSSLVVNSAVAALGYTALRGNPGTPLRAPDGNSWLVVGRSRPDGTAHPAPRELA